MGHDYNAFPVTDSGDTVALLTLSAVTAVPRDDWSTRTVRDVAEPLSDACTVAPSQQLYEVVGKLMSGDLRRVIVVDDDHVSAIITLVTSHAGWTVPRSWASPTTSESDEPLFADLPRAGGRCPLG